MLHQLTITCDYPAQLIGFHTEHKQLTFHRQMPIEDPEEALYAWGIPKDASAVEYTHSDAGYCIYRFETPLPPLEWLKTMRVFYPLLTLTYHTDFILPHFSYVQLACGWVRHVFRL